jgi:cytoskeletal protein CcmA (bactofilin family)
MGLFGKPDPRPAQEQAAPSQTPQAAPQPASHTPKPAGKSTVLGERTRYTGKIDTDEPLLIHGGFEGEIKSSSEVEVAENGVVKATLSARSIIISGRVNGDCTATDKLEIRATGKLTGSIHAARIVVAEGAEFKGTSQMAGSHRS